MPNNHKQINRSQDPNRRTPEPVGGFPSLPTNVMSGMYFGGIATHADRKVGKTHVIDHPSSFITQEDVLSPGFGHSYSGGHMQAYQDIATKLSRAAGKIYIDLCVCHGLKAYDTSRAEHVKTKSWLQHPEACMSGFWIQGSRFVTSAHFPATHSLTEKQIKNTEAYLKAYSPMDITPKAVVCSGGKVPENWNADTKAIPVYLLKQDRDSDIAIFQAYHDEHAPPGLLRSDIKTLAQCDKSQSAFTIGYYGYDVPIPTLTLPEFERQVLNTLWLNHDGTQPATYFPLKCAAVMQTREHSLHFSDIFPYPNHRTISAGDIENVISTQKRSELVSCQISAWYQNSGGMVGGFVRHRVNGQEIISPAVFGIFQGEKGPKNTVAAFTTEGIEWLFN